MLAGDQATEFALEMGFKEESLTTQESKDMWSEWRANNCQVSIELFWYSSITKLDQ